jgi:hypothetical protein
MDFGRKSARLGLLVVVATLVSGAAAQLSGPPAACASTSPFTAQAAAGAKLEPPKREVKTIGMMMAEQDPPV